MFNLRRHSRYASSREIKVHRHVPELLQPHVIIFLLVTRMASKWNEISLIFALLRIEIHPILPQTQVQLLQYPRGVLVGMNEG